MWFSRVFFIYFRASLKCNNENNENISPNSNTQEFRVSPYSFIEPTIVTSENYRPSSRDPSYKGVMQRVSPFSHLQSVIEVPVPSPVKEEDDHIYYLNKYTMYSDEFKFLKQQFAQIFNNINDEKIFLYRLYIFTYHHKNKCVPDTIEYYYII